MSEISQLCLTSKDVSFPPSATLLVEMTGGYGLALGHEDKTITRARQSKEKKELEWLVTSVEQRSQFRDLVRKNETSTLTPTPLGLLSLTPKFVEQNSIPGGTTLPWLEAKMDVLGLEEAF